MRPKVEALVRYGAVQLLGASLEQTDFHAGALRSQRHKPIRFSNRNEYARSAAQRTNFAYLMQKNGDWHNAYAQGARRPWVT